MKTILKNNNADTAKQPAPADPNVQLRRQTLLAHLRDLRKMLLISGAAILVSFVVIFFGFAEQLVEFLIGTIRAQNVEIIYTALTETFSVQAKASLIAGVVVAAPIVLWQVWAFVVPALYKKERLTFTLLYLAAILLFVAGVLFAYVIVFNMAVNFFIVFGENLATPMLSIKTYVDFLFSFILPFGVVFELPIAIAVMTQTGLITTATLTKYRKYVIFGIFILSAILTPPDVVSQVMLAVPLIFLYEVGIIVSRVIRVRKKKSTARA